MPTRILTFTKHLNADVLQSGGYIIAGGFARRDWRPSADAFELLRRPAGESSGCFRNELEAGSEFLERIIRAISVGEFHIARASGVVARENEPTLLPVWNWPTPSRFPPW